MTANEGEEVLGEQDNKAAVDPSAVDALTSPISSDRATAQARALDEIRRTGFVRRGSVAAVEAACASGFVKHGGAHVALDGIVSRRGFRRILPETSSYDRSGMLDYRSEQLVEAAKCLTGRYATVFEGRVLAVVLGQPRQSTKELAEQLGTTKKRIYKIEKAATKRVQEHLGASKPPA